MGPGACAFSSRVSEGWLCSRVLDGRCPASTLSSLGADCLSDYDEMAWWLQHPLLTDVAGNILVHRPMFIVENVLTQGMTEVKTSWKNVQIQKIVQVYGVPAVSVDDLTCHTGWANVDSKSSFLVTLLLFEMGLWMVPPSLGCRTGCEQQGCDLNPGAPTPRPSFQPCSVSLFVCVDSGEFQKRTKFSFTGVKEGWFQWAF